MSEKSEKVIGASVTRLEDEPLVRGEGCFVGDISFPHQLHMRVVRSVHAHGRILSVDAAEARDVIAFIDTKLAALAREQAILKKHCTATAKDVRAATQAFRQRLKGLDNGATQS